MRCFRSCKPFSSSTQQPKTNCTFTRVQATRNTRNSSAEKESFNPNLELWKALFTAGSFQLTNSTQASAQSLADGASKLQRYVEAPPAGFPPGPSGEQSFNLLASPLEFLSSTTVQYGNVVGMLLGGERVVIVADPKTAREVLIEQSDVFIKKGTAFFPGSSLTGNGLLVSDGDVWARQRRLSNPAFRKSAVAAYSAAMVAATQSMMDKDWKDGTVRDVYADYNELTLNITLEALFGFGSKEGAAGSDLRDAELIVSAVEKAFEFFTRRAGTGFIVPEWVPTWDNLEFGAAVKQLDKVIYGLINARREELAHGEASSAAKADLLQGMLTTRDDNGQGMTDTALRDELMTLLVAGQETSAILLGWVTALLAHHPQVQDAAAAEVEHVLDGRTPTAADISQLKIVEAVLLEALRLWSPAYMVGRCACRDTQIGGYSIPAGTTTLVSPYIMHRDPSHWTDPEAFKPERWSELQEQPGYGGFMTLMSNLGPNGSYLPFGAGPRNCIGTGFAMMEAVLVVAVLLQRYRVIPRDSTFPTPKPLLTLRPEHVIVRLQRKHSI